MEQIDSSELMPGDRLPSENELIATYEVSNTTARKILQELEIKGYANRIKGKGTYVLNRSKDKHITRVLGSFTAMKGNFSENLRREGFAPRNVILEKVVVQGGFSTNVDGRMFIMEGSFLKLRRLRYGDDLMLKDETRYISMELCPKINAMELNNQTLIEIYEDIYHLKMGSAYRTIGTTLFMPKDPNNYFENSTPLAAFILDSVILNDAGKVVEIEHSYYRGDKYKFSVHAKPEYYAAPSKR